MKRFWKRSTSVRRVRLHAKWSRYLSNEQRVLNVALKKYKELKYLKREFALNPNVEDMNEYGFKPPVRKITPQTVKEYLEGDKDLLDLELKISVQEDKVDFLKTVLSEIRAIGYDIKNAIEDRAFKHGLR